MLAINDAQFEARAEIIWEKGTNRSAFFRGDVDKYGWVDIGSSFLPSELIAAFLWAQPENLDSIQQQRLHLWNQYQEKLSQWAQQNQIDLGSIPSFATNNGHMFYIVCKDLEQRTALLAHLKSNGILAVFHYLSLHNSKYYAEKHDGRDLPMTDHFSDCLIRLPMFYDIDQEMQTYIIDTILAF